MTKAMAAAGENLVSQAEEEHTATDGVIKVIKRFILKSVGWVTIYLVGYYNFSVAWLITPLVLSVLRAQWKSERNHKLMAAREAALTDERQMIESRIRVEDLPSWVFFPDKERAEWINSIIQQLWSNVGHYTRKIISDSVEPAVKSALDGYGLGGFKFEKVVLGRIPPRVTGIKVYEKNTARDEIIMDLDLVFASDCDIKFSLKKISAKIGDFSLRGLLRVVFKPLISDVPLVGGVQVYFLTSPEIDFDLGGVANALDAPGLSNIIRKIVLEQLGHFMVLPNKITVPLSDKVANRDLKCPDYAGVLRVNLIKADKLMKKDVGVLGMGKSDPYATLEVGSRSDKTKIIKNTISPEWFHTTDFPIEVVKGQQLSIEVYDHDDPGDDEFLGRATIATSVVAEQGEINNMWAELEDVAHGRILMSLSWLTTTKDKSVLQEGVNDGLSKCILQVYVDCCHDLISPGKSAKASSKPSPIVELQVGQGECQSSWPQSYTTNPVFEQDFVFLITNTHVDDLHVKVVDSGHKNAVIGTTTIRISDIMAQPDMEYPCQRFNLKGVGGKEVIKLAASIVCLTKAAPQDNEATEDLKPEPVKKKSSTTEPVSMDQEVKETPQEELENKANEDLASEDKVPESKPEQVTMGMVMSAKRVGDQIQSTHHSEKESVPALDQMLANTIAPIAQTTGNEVDLDTFLNREMSLRQRVVPSEIGRVKLTLKFEQDTLTVILYEATGLPGGDLPDPPDPYVKTYLLPDRSKKSKRKSDAKKDTVTPIWNETFEYEIPAMKMASHQLEVSVVDRKGIFSRRSTMGRCVIDLAEVAYKEINQKWFDLAEVDEDSD